MEALRRKTGGEVEMVPLLESQSPRRQQQERSSSPPKNSPLKIPTKHRSTSPPSSVISSPRITQSIPLSISQDDFLPFQSSVLSSSLNDSITPTSSPRLYPSLTATKSKSKHKKLKSELIIRESDDQENLPAMEGCSPIVTTKRCVRCTRYYNSNEKNPCIFHPGRYKRGYSSPLIAGAAIEYWTCCKSMNKNEPGCKEGKHKEDKQMNKLLQNFPIKQEEPKEEQATLIDFSSFSTPLEDNKTETKQKPKEKQETPNYNVFTHYVMDTDTLVGLSLRYNVSSKLIKQINRMPNDFVQGYSRLYIPKRGYDLSTINIPPDDEELALPENLTDEEKALVQKRLLARLRSQTGMSNEEAHYYMDLFGYSYVQALKEYKEDIEWEKRHPHHPAAAATLTSSKVK